mgnify:CR=1 FL=1
MRFFEFLPFGSIPFLIFISLSVLGYKILSVPFLLLVVFLLWFFRDPERNPENLSEYDVLSPADGKVIEISNNNEGKKKISIFMSPLDVHVNRSPVDALIISTKFEKGSFLRAYEKNASTKNTKHIIVEKISNGEEIILCQVSGALARRIIPWIKRGDTVKRGQRIGMIAFGSRVDVYLPHNFEIAVKEGQKVKAGLSKIAEIPRDFQI